MKRVLGALLLLAFAFVAWHILAFVTGLVFTVGGLAVLAGVGYVLYRLLLRGR